MSYKKMKKSQLLKEIGSLQKQLTKMGDAQAECKKVKEQLRKYQRQLQSLVSELSLAEQRERRRIAIDLHDHIGQTLAASNIKLGALQELASSSDLAEPLGEIRELIGQMILYTRSLTLELSPPILYELGLEAALEWLAEDMQKQSGIVFDFDDDGQAKPLSNHVRILLFKAVRELMINIVTHAGAGHAKVSIHKVGDDMQIDVEDDGVGFVVSENGAYMNRTGGFGLFSIRERLSYLGGTLKVQSEPGHGTKVTLVAPRKLKRSDTGG